MTEQEAINMIKRLNVCGLCTTGPCGDCERKQAKDAALLALEEIQKYRDMENRLKNVYGGCDGLLETVVEQLEKHEKTELPEPVFKARLLTDDAVDRWEAYKAIGTVEECRAAREKQIPKNYERGLGKEVRCPVCGTYTTDIYEHRYCTYCGQRLA